METTLLKRTNSTLWLRAEYYSESSDLQILVACICVYMVDKKQGISKFSTLALAHSAIYSVKS